MSKAKYTYTTRNSTSPWALLECWGKCDKKITWHKLNHSKSEISKKDYYTCRDCRRRRNAATSSRYRLDPQRESDERDETRYQQECRIVTDHRRGGYRRAPAIRRLY